MPHRRPRFLPGATLLALVLLARPAWPNTAVVTASCTGTGVDLTVNLDITTPLPALWTGWAITRWAIGPCEDAVPLVGPIAFPNGAGSWAFADPTSPPGITCKYVMWAVDAQGHLVDLGFEAFPARWTTDAYASCHGAAVVRGSLGGTEGSRTWMFVCNCWEYVSYVEGLPAGLEPFVGTDTNVELVGTLLMGPEGPYITDVTGWRLPDACEAVGTAQDSWGGVKAQYR